MDLVCPWVAELSLDAAIECISDDRAAVFPPGLVTDPGSELLLVPRLAWQVEHNLIHLEMRSLGTLHKAIQSSVMLRNERPNHEYTFLT